jgi:ABC-type amino acid transport substrate-binding protein
MFLLAGKTAADGTGKVWSVEQAWYLVKSLAASDSETLRYHEVLRSDTFASSTTVSDGEAALEGLANAELITVKSHNGRPEKITPGKPVYQAAFKQLAQDQVLAAALDLNILTELSKIEGKTIEKIENELALLGSLPRQPAQTTGRINYLLAKLENSQKKVEGYEKDMTPLKRILATEY